MDGEAPIRREVVESLSPYFEMLEEQPVIRLGGSKGRVDVLARPRPFPDITVIFEVKERSFVEAPYVADWIKQTFDYVGASPLNGWPPIAAGFVWMVDIEVESDSQVRCSGMFQLAQRFRVGLVTRENRGGLSVRFGSGAELLRTSRNIGPWLPKARDLLFATRISGGSRRGLEAS